MVALSSSGDTRILATTARLYQGGYPNELCHPLFLISHSGILVHSTSPFAIPLCSLPPSCDPRRVRAPDRRQTDDQPRNFDPTIDSARYKIIDSPSLSFKFGILVMIAIFVTINYFKLVWKDG